MIDITCVKLGQTQWKHILSKLQTTNSHERAEPRNRRRYIQKIAIFFWFDANLLCQSILSTIVWTLESHFSEPLETFLQQFFRCFRTFSRNSFGFMCAGRKLFICVCVFCCTPRHLKFCFCSEIEESFLKLKQIFRPLRERILNDLIETNWKLLGFDYLLMRIFHRKMCNFAENKSQIWFVALVVSEQETLSYELLDLYLSILWFSAVNDWMPDFFLFSSFVSIFMIMQQDDYGNKTKTNECDENYSNPS